MSRIKPWHIVLAGWLGFVIYAYPGMMTRDSYDQLIEARSGELSDAHPPMMSAIWSVIDTFLAGPFGLILLQTSTFVIGGYLLVRRVLTPKPAAITAIALLWFPPIGSVMAVAWKDCLMAGFFLLGIALLFVERRRPKLLALVLLTIATAVRYNALAATLVPIVLLFTWQDAIRGWRRYALALAVWLVTTFVALGANRLLTSKPTHIWHSSLALHDIVGTIYYAPRDIEDRKLRRVLEGTPLVVQHNIQAHIRAHYKPDDLVWIVLGPDRMFDMSLVVTAPEPQREAVERAWSTLIRGNLIAYARHRLAVMGTILGISGESWNRPIIVTHDYQNPQELLEVGVPRGYSAYQAGIDTIYSACSKTWLFRPFIYLAIALALIVFGRRQRDVLALLGSGLGVEGSLLLIGPSADYRYSHWLIVATCLALVLVVVRRYQEGRG